MKNLFLVAALIAAISLGMFGCPRGQDTEPAPAVSVPQPQLSGPKLRVGIFEFENKSRYGKNRLSDSAVDVLYSLLQKADAFVLYERADLDELQKEFDLIDSGLVNINTAAEAGRLVGVNAIVVGTITQFGMWEEAKDYGAYKQKVEIAEATVDVRVVDVTTGRIVYADTGTGRSEREIQTVFGFGEKASFDETMADKTLRAALSKLIDNLIREIVQMPWEGYVMDVDQQAGREVLYINAGLLSGMPMGQRLVVKEVTGKLTDPVTGEFKGFKTRRIGEAQVFEFTGEDVSIAHMIEGSGAKRGDMVSLPR